MWYKDKQGHQGRTIGCGGGGGVLWFFFLSRRTMFFISKSKKRKLFHLWTYFLPRVVRQAFFCTSAGQTLKKHTPWNPMVGLLEVACIGKPT